MNSKFNLEQIYRGCLMEMLDFESHLTYFPKTNGKHTQGGIMGVAMQRIDSRNELSIQSHIQAVERGLPFEVFTWLLEELDVSKSELAEMSQISTRTLNRRKKRGFFSPTESKRLYRFEQLLKAADRLFATRDAARQWLKTPVRALGGFTPLQFAKHETISHHRLYPGHIAIRAGSPSRSAQRLASVPTAPIHQG